MKKLTINEEIILVTVWHLGDSAYGVNIMKEIKSITGNSFALGTLYNLMEQLIKKGYVSSRKGEPNGRRGGHNKVYYRLSAAGEKALQEARSLQEKLWADVPKNAFGTK